MNLFLPNPSPQKFNCYDTNLFKLLFYIPDIIFYVSNLFPNNIPKKFCYTYDNAKLEKRMAVHYHVCRVYQDRSYIVFRITDYAYECQYDHLNYSWKICNLHSSYDKYQITDHMIEFSFFVRLGIPEIYEYAFDKQKAIFCNKYAKIFLLLNRYVQNVVIDLIFDKIIKISDNTELIQFRIR
uniref:Uncharacterized protein n=1 Tax=viral metagenome TaxID=1070528 RepID=A0A6C0C9U6_9ZZZZ